LRVQVEAPPSQIDDGTSVDTGNMTILIDGQPIGPKQEPLSAANFSLLDAKGRSLEVVKAITTGVRAGAAQEVELTYRPTEGQAGLARFVYTGRRSSLVEVPFMLKDVPLP